MGVPDSSIRGGHAPLCSPPGSAHVGIVSDVRFIVRARCGVAAAAPVRPMLAVDLGAALRFNRGSHLAVRANDRKKGLPHM